jgi:amino acid transporter
MSTATSPASSRGPHLRRSLTLWNLIIYGIIIIQPIAPMGIYGGIANKAHGHVITTILIAMVAMMFTALSYGKMARAYPSAGSAYTYVGSEISPVLGYLTGWSMVMDYMINPLICIIICSDLTHMAFPVLPKAVLAVFFAAMFTFLNLRGVKTSAKLNNWLAAGMGVVVVVFLAAAVRYIFGMEPKIPGFFTRPLYDPQNFSSTAVFQGTSLAVLTYIGFDGISTLSEEVENPRRNILLATVLVCLVTGVLSSVEVYAAQLVSPWTGTIAQPDTAFVHVAELVGGLRMFHLLSITLLAANIGSGMGAQLGAARLLYGMGRGNALPKSFFGAVDAKSGVPANNVLLIGALALAGAFLMTYEMGAELLNFGAFIAFMGVNLAAFTRYFLRDREKGISSIIFNLICPLAGFAICAFIWWNLAHRTKIVGALWLLVGVAYGAVKTRGFRKELVSFETPAE